MADEENAAVETPTETPSPSPTPAEKEAAFMDGLDKVLAGDGAEGAETTQDAPGATAAADPSAAAPSATAAAEPTPEAKAAAELKAKDAADLKALNDSLKAAGHKPLSKAAEERFHALNAEARKVPELTKQVEQLKPMAEQAERINAIFADAQAAPEQIGTMLRYLKAVNSGDPAEMNKAFETIMAEVQHIGKLLGRSVTGFDPVTEHADLNAEIEAGSLTAERAREIAAVRAKEKLTEQNRTRTTQAQNEEAERRKSVDEGIAAVNAFGAEMQTKDPHYKAKVQQLTDKGVFDGIKSDTHPSKWASAVRRAYALIPDPAPAPAPAPVGHMPLRPSGAGAGSTMQAKPKNPEDAFDMGLARAGGRLG